MGIFQFFFIFYHIMSRIPVKYELNINLSHTQHKLNVIKKIKQYNLLFESYFKYNWYLFRIYN